MSPGALSLDLILIYFFYGLAFISLGIAVVLETGRIQSASERQTLQPLALFGMLHGAHEWMEIIILQGVWLGQPYQMELSWLRVSLLASSFLPLSLFAFYTFFPPLTYPKRAATLSALQCGVFLLAASLVWYRAPSDQVIAVDALARYILAVPSALLGGAALLRQARQMDRAEHRTLARLYQFAGIGFIVYGLTQVFVPAADISPARYINAATFRSALGFPIQLVRAIVASVITFSMLRAAQWTERERQLELADAQNARMEALEQIQQELIKRATMRRQLLRHIVIAQEDERARIARELHDETAQFLTAISLDLATLRKSAHYDEASSKVLTRLQNNSREMSQGVYRLVHDLRPAQLDDLGLVPALQHLGDETGHQLGLKVIFESEGVHQRIDPVIETVFFRVAQEALTNVARHSKTDCAQLKLLETPEQITMHIMDEGVGFNPAENIMPPRGWGLAGMRERVESVGGTFRIRSAYGTGTDVIVTVPVSESNVPGLSEGEDL